MLISKDLNAAINAQVGHELQAMLQYINIATYFDGEALSRTAKFFYDQAEDEHAHAMKFIEYIVDAGGSVAIPAIPAPKAVFQNAEEAVELAYNWEKVVTKNIIDLMDIAVKEKDYIAQQFLNWYLNEQLEEESTMSAMLSVVKRATERNLIMLEGYFSHMKKD
jgi:bacterioferritin B